MFSTSEHISCALWALYQAHVSALTSVVDAAIEAGVRAAESNADAVRTAHASTTVLARQWLAGTESNTTPGHTGLQLEQ